MQRTLILTLKEKETKMVDFTNLLSKSADTVERPEPLPAGSYLTTITGYRTVESGQKKTPGVEFDLQITAPGDDVDAEAYAKVKNPQERVLKTQFWLTEDSLFRLKDFLEKAGFETAGRTFVDMLAEVAGHQIISLVSHRVSQDGESVFPEAKKFMKVA